MRYFVHLKDNIVFAYHQSETEVDIEGDNIVQVTNSGETYLGKKYENGNFIDAPVIKYAIIDSANDNIVVGIEETIYSSDIKGPIISDPSVKVLWKWNGSEFVAPNTPTQISTAVVFDTVVTTSSSIQARTEEDFAADDELREIQNSAPTPPVVEEE